MKTKWKRIIAFIIMFLLSTLCFYKIFLSASNYSSMRSSEDEHVELIRDGESISQKVALCDTSYIKIEMMAEYNSDKIEPGIVNVSINNDENLLKSKDIQLLELPNGSWDYVEITDGNLEDYVGDVWIKISLDNASDDCNLKFVVIGGRNQMGYPIQPQMKINDNEVVDETINLSMDYVDMIRIIVLSIGFALIFSTLVLIMYINRNGVYLLVRNNAVIIAGAVLIIFTYIQRNPYKYSENPWTFFIYLIGYRYGLVSKAFPGAIISLFVKFLTHRMFVSIILVVTILVFALEAYLIKMRKGTAKYTSDINNLSIIYFASPWFLTGLANQGMFGHPDIFVLLFYLLCLICLFNDKLAILLPFCAVAGVLTHQQFVFIVFPFLCIIMLYKIYKERDRKQIVVYSCTIIFSAVFSFYSQFVSEINVPLDQLVADMQTRTSMTVSADPYYWEFYASIKEVMTEMALPNLSRMQYLLLAILVASPFIIYIRDIITYAITNKKDKVERILLLVTSITFLGVIVLWALAADWGRYVYTYANCMIFFVLFCAKNNNILNLGDGLSYANEKMKHRLGEYWLVIIVIYSIACGIGTWGAGSFYDDWNYYFDQIVSHVRNLQYVLK